MACNTVLPQFNYIQVKIFFFSLSMEEIEAMAAKIEANSIRLFFVYFISMIGGLFIIG